MIQRVDSPDGKMILGYHTQEERPVKLDKPIICDDDLAWLGEGYYFWVEEEFARIWGEDKKKKATGSYSIYSAWIMADHLLNTTFREADYFFFKECIEEAIQNSKNLGEEINLKDIHQYMKDTFWDELGVTGIIYDDLPINTHKTSKFRSLHRVHSEVKPLYYKKRIQIVVFDLGNIRDFKLHL